MTLRRFCVEETCLTSDRSYGKFRTSSDTEKSSHKEKDTSGNYVWTDVFVKRDGKWQAARSQGAMLR